MTATPESLLDEVMAAVALLGRDAVVEGYYQDALAESVRQAVEAYGRACADIAYAEGRSDGWQQAMEAEHQPELEEEGG